MSEFGFSGDIEERRRKGMDALLQGNVKKLGQESEAQKPVPSEIGTGKGVPAKFAEGLRAKAMQYPNGPVRQRMLERAEAILLTGIDPESESAKKNPGNTIN